MLFIFQLSIFKPVWVLVDYRTNYDYIVEVLCENKDVPESSCNGTCYLNKQLSEIAKEQSPNNQGEKSQDYNRTKSDYIPSKVYQLAEIFREENKLLPEVRYLNLFESICMKIDSPPPQFT